MPVMDLTFSRFLHTGVLEKLDIQTCFYFPVDSFCVFARINPT